MSKRVWGVLLTEAGLSELQEALRPYIRKGPIGQYLYCQSVELSSPFAQLTAESTSQTEPFLAELYVPLHHIKFVVVAADAKQLGFA